MNTVIFLGPSLDLDTARTRLPEATFLPPAAQFDLISAVRRYEPRVVGLIDGVFHQEMSVWHKEILLAMHEGVHVFGASSMGAMRAAELAAYGMRGVGQVFEWYHDGTIDRDDEVALVHGDADSGYRSLSEPLVNTRATIAAAIAHAAIDEAAGERLLEAARALQYPERTIASIVAAAIEAGLDEAAAAAFESFHRESARDVKRDDALLLLDTIADLGEDLPPFESDFDLQRAHVLHAALERDISYEHNGGTVTAAELAYHAALHMPAFNTFNFNALNRALVVSYFDMLELDLPEGAVANEARRFRTTYGLANDDEFAEWLSANHLTPQHFDDLMTEVAKCRRMQYWLITNRNYRGTANEIVNTLRLENRYVENADELVRKTLLLDGDLYGFARRRLRSHGVREMVVEHLRATPARMSVDYRTWMWESGFPDDEALAVELERSRLSRVTMDSILETLLSSVDDEGEQ